MVLNKARAVSERFQELSELCQDREGRDHGLEEFLQQLLSSERYQKKKTQTPQPTQKINWSVNPLNFQGIIFI